jgi:hypothetical protein
MPAWATGQSEVSVRIARGGAPQPARVLAVAEFADVGVIGGADDVGMGTAPLGG